MFSLNKKQTEMVDELISACTGFSPREENFKLCHQFINRKLTNHRYLDTEAYHVNKRVDGLVEKFDIHSEFEKQKALRSLVDTFVDAPLSLADCEPLPPRSPLHYSLLNFVLEMQDCPLKGAKYTLPSQEALNSGANVGLDWHKLLMEDMDEYVRDDYKDDRSSDEEMYDDDPVDVNHEVESFIMISRKNKVPEKPKYLFQKPFSGIEIQNETMEPPPLHPTYMVQPEYWQSNNTEVVVSHERSNRVHQDFDDYSAALNEGELQTCDRTILSEYQVIREVLWLLLGTESSFLFSCDYNPKLASKNVYRFNQSVAVHHLTNGALDELLLQFMKWGSICRGVEALCNYVTNNTANLYLEGEPPKPIPLVISTFMNQVRILLTKFHNKLHFIESNLRKQHSTTLLSISIELRPWFRRLGMLRDIIYGATAGRFEAFHWESSVISLLDLLYDSVCALTVVTSDAWMFQWVKLVFARSFEPYLYSLDALLSGQPLQLNEDMFLLKNITISVKDPNYWQSSYTLKKQENQAVFCSIPKILHPFVRKLIVTIKSMDLLKNICTQKVFPDLLKDVMIEPGGFIGEFNSKLVSDQQSTEGISDFLKDIKYEVRPFELGNYPLTDLVDDPLYMDIFHSQFVSMHTYTTDTNPTPIKLDDQEEECEHAPPATDPEDNTALCYYERWNLPGIQCLEQPELLEMILYNTLNGLISVRCHCINTRLVKAFLEDIGLRKVLHSLRSVFLMEAGDVMYDFTWTVFQYIRDGEEWRDITLLNMRLRECVDACLGYDETGRFWISLVSENNQAQRNANSNERQSDVEPRSGNLFEAIRLHYDIPWPLYFVVSEDDMNKYNQVFLFLFQLKHIKFCLDQLHFVDLADSGNSIKFKPTRAGFTLSQTRLQLLRLKALHVVNTLHQFIFTRIHTYHLQLDAALSTIPGITLDAPSTPSHSASPDVTSVEDLIDLIGVHRRFIDSVHRVCLLNPDSDQVSGALGKVLDLARSTAELWLRGGEPGDSGGSGLAARLDDRLTRYVQFLGGLFSEAAKRESLAHLQPLADSFTAFT